MLCASAGLYDSGNNLLCTWEESGLDLERDDNAERIEKYFPTAKTLVICCDGVNDTICLNSFIHCAGIENIIIRGANIIVGSQAFRDCKSLRYVSIQCTSVSIGSYAFSDCIMLQNVEISGIVLGHNYGFDYCTALTHISFKSTLLLLDAEFFTGCKRLSNISAESCSPENCSLTIKKNRIVPIEARLKAEEFKLPVGYELRIGTGVVRELYEEYLKQCRVYPSLK